MSPLHNYDFRLSIHKFLIHTRREAWAKVFYDLKEGNIQWMFKEFMPEKIVVNGATCPFLILLGIKGVRPYNPSRVMRQFGRRQILRIQGDTSSFLSDYNG